MTMERTNSNAVEYQEKLVAVNLSLIHILILQFRNKIIFEKTIKNPLQKGFHCYIILLLRSMRSLSLIHI